MTLTELRQLYCSHPQIEAVSSLLRDTANRHIYCGGLTASSASFFASLWTGNTEAPFVFILNDLEEAGYFYHDLTQVLGTEQV
ncbi:MAG: hypothetical protein LUF04_12850, partial [Bacteroides sp.]|nr:hypothetical protein [Bacteroides sp.]